MKKLLNTPARVVIAVGVIVLATEILVMTIIHDAIAPLNVPDVYWNFIDAILLTLIVSPALYFLVLRKMRESEERFSQLAENIHEAFWLGTPDWNNVLYISPAYEKIWGRSCESLYARPLDWLDAVVDADREKVIDAISRKSSGYLSDVAFPEYRILRPDGSARWVFARAFPIRDAEGKVFRIAGIAEDITERKLAEQALIQSETKFRTLYDSTSDAVMLLDEKGFFDCNNAALAIFGCATREEFCSKHPADLSPPLQPCGTDSLTLANRRIATAMEQGSLQFEWTHQRVDTGKIFHADVLLSKMKLDGKTVLQATVRDISARKQAEEEIRNLAFYDALTKLPNRRLLNDRLSQTMASSKRSGCYGALMFLDMDNFKPLNDAHGHGVGDLLLIEVARRITRCVRGVDTVARFGGDEFVVVLSELDADKSESATQAGSVAEKIRAILAEPYVLAIQPKGKAETITVEHHCTSSIGVVLFINNEASTEDIIRWADMAMYQAKEAGSNLIRFYEGGSAGAQGALRQMV